MDSPGISPANNNPAKKTSTPRARREPVRNSATATTREIALTHNDYKEDKGHGWLEIR